jgi:hypothetical protein
MVQQQLLKKKRIKFKLLHDAEVQTHVEIHLRVQKFYLFNHNTQYHFSYLCLTTKIHSD